MQDFIAGISYFIRGFYLISRPGLKRFVIVPFGINIFFFVLLFFFAQHYLIKFNAWAMSYLPGWLHWLNIIFWLMFLVVFFLVFVYFFLTIANIIASPFNSFLSEKVEYYLTKNKLVQRNFKEIMHDLPEIIGRQLSILLYYLSRAILILLLLLIPLVHPLAVLIWFLFNAWFMAFTYLDYPTDNHKIPLNDLRTWLRSHRAMAMGFGLSILIAAMIPILNFFVIPASVAAATLLWLDVSNNRT